MEFLKWLENFNGEINSFVWGMPGLILLIGTGIAMTLLTKVFQVSHIGHWFKHTIGSLFRRDVIAHSNDRRSISSSCPFIKW